MIGTLSQWEKERVQIVRDIAGLGDFRWGSITGIMGRCGKANCGCHQPGHPGHGPNFRLTRKVQGKTVSETFSRRATLRKAQREVEEFHKFRALSETLVEVNEKICKLRPVEEEEAEMSEAEKNGGSDPARDRAGSRSALTGGFPGSAQERAPRLGSDGDGGALGPAPGGCCESRW